VTNSHQASPARGPSVLTSWARTIIRALDRRGLAGDALAARAGLDLARLTDADARYPVAAMTRLWKLAVEATGDPCLGLEVSRHVTMTSFHALTYSVLASLSLREAFERLARYNRIVSDAAEVRLDEEDDAYRLSLVVPNGPERPADEALDAFTSLIARGVRILRHDRAAAPLAVWLERPEPVPSEPFRRVFRAPVHFSASTNRLTFARSLIDARLPEGNADLARANDAVVRQYLARYETERVANRVQTMLAEHLAGGEPSQGVVARRLGMGLRTLQRRLAAEDTSFAALLAETRRELACSYMEAGGLSVSEIAYLVGFSDTSTFSRAFKRWTGRSPTEYAAGG